MIYRDLISVPTFDPQEAAQHAGDPLFVRSVARAVAVLSAFDSARNPLTLNEVATLAGLERSAAQRMVHTLMQLGLIRRDAQDRGYLPGARLLTMAYSALRLNPAVQSASPILLELRRRTRERVDMSLWDDVRLIYTIRMPSKHEFFTATLTGNTVPVYCTAGGLAVLSRLADGEIADIFARSDRTPFTPDTMTTLEAVMVAVEATRQRGHAIATAQLVRHEVALGAPILEASGRPIGAVHLAGSLAEHDPIEFSAKFGPMLEAAAKSITRAA